MRIDHLDHKEKDLEKEQWQWQQTWNNSSSDSTVSVWLSISVWVTGRWASAPSSFSALLVTLEHHHLVFPLSEDTALVANQNTPPHSLALSFPSPPFVKACNYDLHISQKILNLWKHIFNIFLNECHPIFACFKNTHGLTHATRDC